MSWSSGVFTRFFGSTGWQDDKAAATKILASRHDSHDQDLAQGLNVLLGNLQLNAHFKVGSAAGTNTVTGALSPALTSYAASMYVVLQPANTNTGATTLNLNGLGALAVQNVDGTACVGGELVTGIPALLLLNSGATAWIIQAPANAFDIRINNQASNYTFALTDRGKMIVSGAGGPYTFTIPANASVAFPIGSAISLTNFSAGSSSLAITTDTLFWPNGSGAAPTGTRTIASASNFTIVKITATQWIVTGSGIS